MKTSLVSTCRALLSLVLMCAGVDAVALDRDLSIAQYQHTSWTAKDGVPLGIWEIEQTEDGWIWLAGPNGLYRFDGVQFERVPVPEESGTDAPAISRLVAGPDDTLWIGHFNGGVSVLRNGRATRYGAAAGFDRVKITAIRTDRDGTVWAASRLAVYRFDGQRWTRLGASWNIAMPAIDDLRFDTSGTLWLLGSAGEIESLRPGATRFESAAPLFAHSTSIQLIDGAVWQGDEQRFRRMPGSAVPPPSGAFRTRHEASIVDKDHNLWTVYCPAGVCRSRLPAHLEGTEFARVPVEESFTFADGLSSDLGMTLLEDHNGSIWVVTRTGLDRFRRAAMVSVPLPKTASNLAMAPRDATSITVSAYAPAANSFWSVDHAATPLAAVQGTVVSAMYRDRLGRTWIGSRGNLWRSTAGEWEQMPLHLPSSAAGEITSIDSDTRGLVLHVGNLGPVRYDAGVLTPVGTSLPPTAARCLAVDGAEKIWVGYVDNRVAVIGGGAPEVIYERRDGIDVGAVTYIATGRDVVIAGDLGVDVRTSGRFHKLQLSDPERAVGVTGIVQMPSGDLWLNGSKGAVRIAAAELARLDGPTAVTLRSELFDVLDGYPSSATSIRPRPSLIEGGDGRLWFAGISGLSWLNPRDIRADQALPHLVFRGVASSGKRYAPGGDIELPEHASSIDIQYAALGTVLPERTLYRRRLDGADNDWREADRRREAAYGNLGPGHYRFHVRAVDDQGAWWGPEADLEFAIRPAYYQTRTFAAACGVALAVAAWLFVAWMLRRSTARTREKMQDRLEERERIARELHDTLLQGMQGLILRIQSIAERIPSQDRSRTDMELALQRADSALIEARDRVANLRDPSVETDGLVRDLEQVGHELSRDYSADFRLAVLGVPRALVPAVHAEALKLATEALLNAFRHADANRIDAAVRFGRWSFGIEVRDDGKGIAPAVLDEGKPGHWGLSGMRERAATVGARLRIHSKPAEGTRIELRLKARLAYARAPRRPGHLPHV